MSYLFGLDVISMPVLLLDNDCVYLRLLILCLLQQGHIAETTRSSHEAPRAAERTVITDLLASSDRGLALRGRCLAECRLNAGAATTANGNRGDASASAEAELAEVKNEGPHCYALGSS